jgi:hypothetical protein
VSLEKYLYRKWKKSQRKVKRLKSGQGWGDYYFRLADALQTELSTQGVLLDQYAEAVNQRTAELQAADAEIDRLKNELVIADERANSWRTKRTGLYEIPTPEDDKRLAEQLR